MVVSLEEKTKMFFVAPVLKRKLKVLACERRLGRSISVVSFKHPVFGILKCM